MNQTREIVGMLNQKLGAAYEADQPFRTGVKERPDFWVDPKSERYRKFSIWKPAPFIVGRVAVVGLTGTKCRNPAEANPYLLTEPRRGSPLLGFRLPSELVLIEAAESVGMHIRVIELPIDAEQPIQPQQSVRPEFAPTA
jgi:hypothetical protein